MSFIGLLRTLEQISRPPRLGHDVDVEDGAAQLAEREAEEEVSEPRQCQTHPRTGWKLRTPGSATPRKVCNMCDSPIPGTDYNYCDYHRGAVFADFADTPNSTESSPLSWTGPPSPLNKGHGPSCRIPAPHYITPTGMDHQCYCARPQGHPLDDFGHRPHICPCGQLWADLPTQSSASNHTGTGAEPAPSPTIVQSAPPPTEGSPADSDIPPSPAGERPPHPVPREQRQGTYCEDYETDGCSVDVCPDGCYHALKFRDDAAAEWIGGAVPVICGVLARHVPVNTSKHTPSVFCNSITGQYCHEYADWQAWREHIAPILANALAPQDK